MFIIIINIINIYKVCIKIHTCIQFKFPFFCLFKRFLSEKKRRHMKNANCCSMISKIYINDMQELKSSKQNFICHCRATYRWQIFKCFNKFVGCTTKTFLNKNENSFLYLQIKLQELNSLPNTVRSRGETRRGCLNNSIQFYPLNGEIRQIYILLNHFWQGQNIFN